MNGFWRTNPYPKQTGQSLGPNPSHWGHLKKQSGMRFRFLIGRL